MGTTDQATDTHRVLINGGLTEGQRQIYHASCCYVHGIYDSSKEFSTMSEPSKLLISVPSNFGSPRTGSEAKGALDPKEGASPPQKLLSLRPLPPLLSKLKLAIKLFARGEFR